MNGYFKVAIIGGGASGLMCACELIKGENRLSGEDIVIIEKNDRVGKKLLVTGNGQCNITNESVKKENYHGDKDFIESFIKNYEKLGLKDRLLDLGIILTSDEDGKVYPLSHQANSVLDNLRAFINYGNVNVLTQCEVKSLVFRNGVFEINGGEIKAEKVVLSCGGKAGKQFGTDGSAYELAKSFNHTVSSLYPSIVQIKTDTANIKGLKGLKEKARVFALINGKPEKTTFGDVLFTDYGVSGDAIFNISDAVVGKENAQLLIEFLPDKSFEETVKLVSIRSKLDFIDRTELLSGILNKRIGQAVLKVASDTSPESVSLAIKNFKLEVKGGLGFDYAQTTKGGIYTKDIISSTFESKLKKGLYITGEALNIDGACGGYNLAFAFTSGILAGIDVKNKFINV